MDSRPPGAMTATASPSGCVLLADHEPLLLRALSRILKADEHVVRFATIEVEIDEHLLDPSLDVVLLGCFMGASDGMQILAHIKRERPEVEVIVMTGHASVENSVECMRRGAFDFLTKPLGEVQRIRTMVQNALERRRLVRRNQELEHELMSHDTSRKLVGCSPQIRALARSIRSLHHSDSNVLIQGESGTGKELVARALHGGSPRSWGPIVTVDCSALPESIIESELFGHERGAFTARCGPQESVPAGGRWYTFPG